MINSDKIQNYKVSDFEKLMNKTVKVTLKKGVFINETKEIENVFIGTIVKLSLSTNSPNLPVRIYFLTDNTNYNISANIFEIDCIEI